MAPRKKTANGNIEARLTALRADFVKAWAIRMFVIRV